VGRTLLLAYIPALAALSFLAVFRKAGVPASVLLRDPAATTNAPFYIGLYSHLGALLWAAAATVLFFSAVLVSQRPDREEDRRFFLWWGLLTAVFAIDDLFMVHEEVMPRFLGVPEKAVLLAYVAASVVLIGRFRTVILDTRYAIFLVALTCLGLSLVFDRASLGLPLPRAVLDDVFKFLGIVGWLTYFSHTAATRVQAGRVPVGEGQPATGISDSQGGRAA
jgi:hypothetical protein